MLIGSFDNHVLALVREDPSRTTADLAAILLVREALVIESMDRLVARAMAEPDAD